MLLELTLMADAAEILVEGTVVVIIVEVTDPLVVKLYVVEVVEAQTYEKQCLL